MLCRASYRLLYSFAADPIECCAVRRIACCAVLLQTLLNAVPCVVSPAVLLCNFVAGAV
jgi:hypothetical protein